MADFERAEEAQRMLFDSVVLPDNWEIMSDKVSVTEDESNQMILAEYYHTKFDVVATVYLRENLGEHRLQVFFEGINSQEILDCHLGETLSQRVAKELGAEVDVSDFSEELHPIEERMLRINSEGGI